MNVKKFPNVIGHLPPGVVGSVTGYLNVILSNSNWISVRPGPTAVVRINWWGESKTDRFYLKPHSADMKERRARYEIHCGFKQLESYILDMKSLLLQVMSSRKGKCIGKVFVDNLDLLISRKTIEGLFPVISESGETIGNFRLIFTLEEVKDDDGGKKGPNLLVVNPLRVSRSTCTSPRKSKCVQNDSAIPTSADFSTITWQNAVATLLEKARRLRKEMTDILIEDSGLLDNFGKTVKSFSVSTAVDVLQTVWRTKADSANQIDVEEAIVNLIHGDKLNYDEIQAIKALNQSSTWISSDEDVSEIDNPIYDESIINGLLFTGNNINSEMTHSQTKDAKKTMSPKKITKPINSSKSAEFPVKRFGIQSSRKEQLTKPITKSTAAIQRVASSANKLGENSNIGRAESVQNEKSVQCAEKPMKATFTSHIEYHPPLQCLIVISSGSGFVWSDSKYPHPGCRERNVYLICRTFWSSDVVRSNICWNASDPQFNFEHIAPIKLTDALLNRLKNNIMVVEVWERKLSPNFDKLFGLAKLPLNVFSSTFRDEEIADAFFRSQQAVIAVNGGIPITDIYSGKKVGQLEMLLAMGTILQIENLRFSKDLVPFRDIQPCLISQGKSQVQHFFEISVKLLKLENPPGSTFWGECHCYLQYLFPTSDKSYNDKVNGLSLCMHKLGPQLCEPIVQFQNSVDHVISLAPEVLIQRALHLVFPRQGLPFQLWCQYYYPTESIELFAEAHLPVSKLLYVISEADTSHSPSISHNFSLDLVRFENSIHVYEISSPVVGFFEIQIRYRKKDAGSVNSSRGYRECRCNKVEQILSNDDVPVDDRNLISKDAVNAVKSVTALPEVHSSQQVTKQTKDDVILDVSIEKGNNLLTHEETLPNTCVSMPFVDSLQELVTKIVASSRNPSWNWQGEVVVPKEIIENQNKVLVFKLWNVGAPSMEYFVPNESGTLIGFISVDISPLIVGLHQLSGWYNIIDYEGKCRGQIKITLKPVCGLESISSGYNVKTLTTQNSSTQSTNKYTTTAQYYNFPSHVTRFTEQAIHIQTLQTVNKIPFEAVEPSAKHEEIAEPSRSFLAADLSEKLSEIDKFQQMMEERIRSKSDGDDQEHQEETVITAQPLNEDEMVRTLDVLPVARDKSPKAEVIPEIGQTQKKRSRIAASIFATSE